MLKAYDVHARDTAPRYLHVVSDFGLGMAAWRFLRTWSVDNRKRAKGRSCHLQACPRLIDVAGLGDPVTVKVAVVAAV